MSKKAKHNPNTNIDSLLFPNHNTTDNPNNTNINTQQQTVTVKKANKWNRNGFGQAVSPLGKFTPFESQIIKEQIELYCEKRSFPPSQLCAEGDHRNDQYRGAWMIIAQALPKRTVQSVYRHGLRLYHPFKRGVWSVEEVEQLKVLVKEYGKKWAEIQQRMNRSSESCRDKYREVYPRSYQTDKFSEDGGNGGSGNDTTAVVTVALKKGKWQKDEDVRLEAYVRDAVKSQLQAVEISEASSTYFSSSSSSDNDEEKEYASSDRSSKSKSKGGNIDEKDMDIIQLGQIIQARSLIVNWNNISQRMVDRTRLSCLKRFRLLAGLKKRSNHNDALATQNLSGAEVNVAATATTAKSINSTTATSEVNVMDDTNDKRIVGKKRKHVYDTNLSHVSSPAPQKPGYDELSSPSSRTSYTKYYISSTTPNPLRPTTTATIEPLSNNDEQNSTRAGGSTLFINDDATSSESSPLSSANNNIPLSPDEYDRYLINTIATSSYETMKDVQWKDLNHTQSSSSSSNNGILGPEEPHHHHHHDDDVTVTTTYDAQSRWIELYEEFVEDFDAEFVENRPLWEIARMMLPNDELEQAEIAARTVEAVLF